MGKYNCKTLVRLVMCNSPIGYPKCKRSFPWLIYIRENSKEMALVLFKVIMEGFNNSFGFSFKGQGLDLVFYFRGEVFYYIKDIIRVCKGKT